MSRLCLTLSFFLLLSLHVLGTLPVPYSGKVTILGVNYYGTAEFVFSLQDAKGVVHWRNGKSEKDSIKVPVQNGRYTVLLGGQGMNPLPPQLFVDQNKLFLKVLFDNGDGQGMRHLAPDQQITATPRALVAEIAKVANTAKVADSVKAGTITTAHLNEQVLKYLKPEITASPILPQEREEGVIRLAYCSPWGNRVDCRVGFLGNSSRNEKALDGRMTDRLISKWRSAAGLAKRGGSPKGPCQQAEPRL